MIGKDDSGVLGALLESLAETGGALIVGEPMKVFAPEDADLVLTEQAPAPPAPPRGSRAHRRRVRRTAKFPLALPEGFTQDVGGGSGFTLSRNNRHVGEGKYESPGCWLAIDHHGVIICRTATRQAAADAVVARWLRERIV